MTAFKTIRIGTRGSALARAQAKWVGARLQERYPGLTVELSIIKTKGDIMQDVSLAAIGGKGLFVKEIEDALLKGEIDLAVHSLKDLPAALPEGLKIGAIPKREDPRDVIISRDRLKLEALPRGARIGTGSLRRSVQLLELLPDLEIVPLRGNLDTRIKKIETENLTGIIVAAAGLRRLGWVEKAAQFLPVETMLPAVGQGALGIEICEGRNMEEQVAFLQDPATGLEIAAERAFLEEIGGGCRLPIAGFGMMRNETILLRGLVGSPDGRIIIRDKVTGPAGQAGELGRRLAQGLISKGGRELLAGGG